MGAGRALEICLDPACERYGLTPIPWAGVAARVMPTGLATEGRPYCLLPLPSATGLPVHVNGFFEVSSNRRDIWHGDDTLGGGRLRSEWNIALLQDVAAPCYVELLLYARSLLHGPAAQLTGKLQREMPHMHALPPSQLTNTSDYMHLRFAALPIRASNK